MDPRDRWAPYTVLGLTLLALLAGWGLRGSVIGGTRTLSDPATGVNIAVPEDWQEGEPGGTVLLTAQDPRGSATTVSVETRELGDREIKLAQQSYIFQLGQQLPSFRVIDPPQAIELNGDSGLRFTYAYVFDPSATNPTSRAYPVVVAATATLVARSGTLYILTTTSDVSREDEKQDALLEDIVQSVRLP